MAKGTRKLVRLGRARFVTLQALELQVQELNFHGTDRPDFRVVPVSCFSSPRSPVVDSTKTLGIHLGSDHVSTSKERPPRECA
jgi:hypothetical protein